MPRTHEDGRLDLASVDALAPEDLSAWIYRRLHDADTDVPDDRYASVGQYYLVGAVYPELQVGTQDRVNRVLLRFLLQLERDEPEWHGRPGDDLILLAMQIGDRNFAEPIRRMAEGGTFLSEERRNPQRHTRLVQALTYLGEKMTPAFWKAQVEHAPVLAFSGMQLHSLYESFGLLRDMDLTNENLRAKLYTAIRGLLASPYTHEDIRTALDDMRPVLSPEAVALVRLALPEVWAMPVVPRHEEALGLLHEWGQPREVGDVWPEAA